MRKFFQVLAISGLLLSPTSIACAHAQGSLGVHVGAPPAPLTYHVPPRPGPSFVWVEGYWYLNSSEYVWQDGCWMQPPYEGAYWVEPYYLDGMYFIGRWEGHHGMIIHDHRWPRGGRWGFHRRPHR